ncbi:MAG: phosphoribosyltransferase family protein [bacterium]|nr:phosphoribosyltransferase family protein [bacterium]
MGLDDSYDHRHDDVVKLSWDDVMRLCRDLAVGIQAEFDPDQIVGIAKAGVIPAAILASMLRKDFYPIRLSRREKDRVVRGKPRLLVPLTEDVRGKKVLIVDEISATGETLKLAVQEAKKKGARTVKTATLYVHSDSFRPNWYGLVSDALIIQPWDFEVLQQGKFIIHPEYQEEFDRLARE